MITWAQRAASPSRFFETWDPVPRWKGQQVSRLRRMVRELTILLARTDSSKKSLITGRSSGAPIPISARNPDLFYEVRLSLHPRQYNPRCGQRLEGVASGYWTVSAKHRVASSAIRVRVPRPPRSLDNYRFCLTG